MPFNRVVKRVYEKRQKYFVVAHLSQSGSRDRTKFEAAKSLYAEEIAEIAACLSPHELAWVGGDGLGPCGAGFDIWRCFDGLIFRHLGCWWNHLRAS